MLVLPSELLDAKNPHPTIGIDGCTIIESCFYEDTLKDVAYLSEHEIIYIRSGQILVKSENEELLIKKGEAVLIKKGQFFEFNKFGKAIGKNYESMLFFIKPQFIKEFIQTYGLPVAKNNPEDRSILKLSKSEILDAFMESVVPYFKGLNKNEEHILKLKTFELLLHLSDSNPSVFQFLSDLTSNTKLSLVRIMESFYTKNLPLEEFAKLSGRSLATFKRDFQSTFNETPGKWLKKRRLKHAKELLDSTKKRPTAIYLDVGFEDYGHFSKSYKEFFGYSPSETN